MEKENANIIPPKHQKTIHSFFEGTPPSAPVSTEKEDNRRKSFTKRTLSVATADNWKNSSLIKCSGEVWLEVNIDPANKTDVSTLACKICK